MYSTTEINAIINNAKQQRADYIGAKAMGAALPVALIGMLALALVQLSGAPSRDQAQQDTAAEASSQNS